MEHLCEKAEEVIVGVDLCSDTKQAEKFESLIIYLNDVLTIVKKYDEEFTPFIIDKIKDNVKEMENQEELIDRGNAILLDSFRTTMRVYKPSVLASMTHFVLLSEFEKNHIFNLFSKSRWEIPNTIMKDILDGFKQYEDVIIKMLKKEKDHAEGTIKGYM